MAIGALYRVQIVFGVISPKRSKSVVTTAVAITIPISFGSPEDSARRSAASAASTEEAVFTILFPIRIVISRRSVFSLIISSDFAPNRPSRTSEAIVGLEVVISAISVPEKNAERKMRIIKISIETGSKIVKIRNKFPLLYAFLKICKFFYDNFGIN